jgi:addiction module HigA family antidote
MMTSAADAAAARRRTAKLKTTPPRRLGVSSRTPIHPGHFLESRFLEPLAISQTELAAALGVSRRRVNELIRGRRAITRDTALRLGDYFDNDPMFWIQLQVAWDMRAAARSARAGRTILKKAPLST